MLMRVMAWSVVMRHTSQSHTTRLAIGIAKALRPIRSSPRRPRSQQHHRSRLRNLHRRRLELLHAPHLPSTVKSKQRTLRGDIILRSFQKISGRINSSQLQEYQVLDPAESHRAIMSVTLLGKELQLFSR